MSNIITTIKNRRAIVRGNREMWHIINSAGTTAMRDELLVMHQRQMDNNRRSA